MKISSQVRLQCKSVLFSLAALLALPAWAGSSPGPIQPTITAVQLEGKDVIISAEVPAGLRRITLQSSQRLGTGAWQPRAVMRLDGQGGKVTFRMPQSPALEILRVRADETEPLPALFYHGTNVFPGTLLSTSTVDPGTVVYLAPTAGGAVDDRAAGPNQESSPTRAVVESDIWRIQGDTLYFFNQYRGLQVVDVANPDAPVLRGTLPLAAAGEQMYVLPDGHITLLAQAGCYSTVDGGSQVLIVSTADGEPSIISRLPVSGQILESRLVGTALYVMTQTYRSQDSEKGSVWEWGTGVFAFDLSEPTAPVARPDLWLSGYGNVLSATDEYLFVSVNDGTGGSIVHCIGIAAPDGTMLKAGAIRVAGYIKDKFKMSLSGDVFTVIAEQWTQSAPDGRFGPVTRLQTFSLADPTAPAKLGELTLADGEQLHATRFDGDRVYVVTFFRVDPLWVVDLSDPTRPAIKGELKVPGWSTYIQPLGDRLITIGLDNSNGWRVAVSLFDVHDPAAPALLSQVPLGDNYSWSEANSDEKAFGFVPEAGLILVPYSSYTTNLVQGVQLVDFTGDKLVKRGFISQNITARRSTVHHDRILSISARELLTVDASDRDKPLFRSQTELAWAVDRLFVQGQYLVELESSSWGANTSPSLRVTSTAAPDRVLTALVLTNLPVAGATVRDGRLYLLQAATTYYPPVVSGTDKDAPPVEGTNLTVFVTSVFDLGKLPALTLLGSAGLNSSQSYSASADAVWPKPDLLVWAARQFSYWRGWYPVGGIAAGRGVSTMPVDMGFGMPYPYYSGTSRLLGVDLKNPVSPQFTSDVDLRNTNSWSSFSSAYVADKCVFVGEQFTETSIIGTNYVVVTNYLVTLVTNVVQGTSGPSPTGDMPTPPDAKDGVWSTNIVKSSDPIIVTNEQPVYAYRQISYLHVIDYAASSTPVVRPPVTVPGALRGLARDGALVYFVGSDLKTDTPAGSEEWLYACAYDRVATYLVDSHALSKDWPHTVSVSDPYVFIGRPSVDSTSARALEIWTLPDTGKLSKVSERKLAGNVSMLQAVSDLLVAQEDGGLELFDLTQPITLPLVGTARVSGCYYWNLPSADGSKQDGLWLPLGLYGVDRIEVKK